MPKLYVTQTCSIVPEARMALAKYNIPYLLYDVDQDAIARDELQRIAHGTLTVPTLVLDDGSAYIEIRPHQIAALFGNPIRVFSDRDNRAGKPRPPMPDLQHDTLLLTSGTLALLFAGLLAFCAGFQVGSVLPSPDLFAFGWLCAAAVFFASILLYLLPVSRKMMSVLSRPLTASPHLRVLALGIYCVLLGVTTAVTLAVSHHTLDALWWAMLLTLSITLVVLLGHATRRWWRSTFKRGQRITRRIGIVTIIGFIGLLVSGQIAGYQTVQPLALLMFFPLGLTALMTALRLAQDIKTGQILRQSQALLYPCVGIIVVIAMLR